MVLVRVDIDDGDLPEGARRQLVASRSALGDDADRIPRLKQFAHVDLPDQALHDLNIETVLVRVLMYARAPFTATLPRRGNDDKYRLHASRPPVA